MRTIAVHSFRGGTGKSTITANVSCWLALQGHKVGVVDLDLAAPGLHLSFRVDRSMIRGTLNDFLYGRRELSEVIIDVTQHLSIENGKLYFIPASFTADEIIRVLREGYDAALFTDGIRAMARGLNLDYILVDTHPGISEDTLLAIAACDVVAVVLRLDKQDFTGTAITLELTRRFGRQPLLVVSQVPKAMVESIVRRIVESNFHYPVAGVIYFDEDVLEASRTREIFVLTRPEHAFSKTMGEIAKRLAGLV